LKRFEEHEVVLPVVVITELEGKRHHPELGYFARTALRMLDDLRISAGRLDAPVPIGDDGGTLRVELNHTDPTSLPAGFRLGDNDTRILAVARNLANEGRVVTIVSKDLPMRVKASACGLEAEEYRVEDREDGVFQVVKEFDDAMDAMRYAFTTRPWYPRPRTKQKVSTWEPHRAPDWATFNESGPQAEYPSATGSMT
jgi:PhoH-like ATPase